jgi:hypothetical protein
MISQDHSIPGQASLTPGAILMEESKLPPFKTPNEVFSSLSGVSEAVSGIMEETTIETRMAKLLEDLSGAVEQTREGLFVTPSRLPNSHAMFEFVNQVFLYDNTSDSRGIHFVLQGLDLPALENILYQDPRNLPGRIRIADGIRPFPEPRKELYRKITAFKDRNGSTMDAKYYFEKLHIVEAVPTVVPGFD